MKKKITGLTLCAMLLALCVPLEAQQPTKIPRIGFLHAAASALRFCGPYRGIPPGSARTGVRRR